MHHPSKTKIDTYVSKYKTQEKDTCFFFFKDRVYVDVETIVYHRLFLDNHGDTTRSRYK